MICRSFLLLPGRAVRRKRPLPRTVNTSDSYTGAWALETGRWLISTLPAATSSAAMPRLHRSMGQVRHPDAATIRSRSVTGALPAQTPHLVQRQLLSRHLGAAHTAQLLTDKGGSRLQREQISGTRLLRRQNDVAQRLAAKLEPHQAAQIVLMDGQLRPGQRTAPEPDAADRACRVAVFRLEAEHPALSVGPAALEAAAFLRRTGTVECRLRQLLFSVAQDAE